MSTSFYCGAESALCHRQTGALGIDFDGGDKNLPAERRRSLVIGQCVQIEFDCLTNIGKGWLFRLDASQGLISCQLQLFELTLV